MRVIKDRPDIFPFIVASLLLHLLILITIPLVALNIPNFEEKTITVFPIADDGKPYQIADIPKPAVEEKPKKSNLIGMYDSRVKDETVGSGRPTSRREGSKRRGDSGRKSGEDGRREASKKKDLFALKPSLFDDDRHPVAKSSEGGQSGDIPDDFFLDFRRGPHTYLNVHRYPNVEYFVRMKRAFRMTFNPGPAVREYFSSTSVVSGMIDVVLGVSVDEKGELAELFIFRSSGIPSYDEEALRTVRASAPFSSPPKEFLEDDGLLRMSWTFSLSLGGV